MNNLAEFQRSAPARDWRPSEGTPWAPAPIRPAPVAESRAKRAFDIVIAAAVILMFLPLLCMVAAAVKLETPGPALFRQRRTGLRGQVFTVYKFRTMTVAEDGAHVPQASRNDARVTALGAILRKLSLDELPQMFNVLRGEMSLIGPRPHALAHDAAWSQSVPNYVRRFRARPGLTGYAAVCGHRGQVHDLQSIVDRVSADNAYIENWSLWLDVKILWRTLPLIFWDVNAY